MVKHSASKLEVGSLTAGAASSSGFSFQANAALYWLSLRKFSNGCGHNSIKNKHNPLGPHTLR